MDQRLTIVGLGVADLAVANDFYENKFGWKKTSASNDSISFFQLNGVLLSLYGREALAEDATVDHAGEGFKAFSIAYNCRSKEEVDQVMTHLESKGVKIVKPQQEVFWGGYSGYIADPDGNLWEIAFNPYLQLDEAGNAVE